MSQTENRSISVRTEFPHEYGDPPTGSAFSAAEVIASQDAEFDEEDFDEDFDDDFEDDDEFLRELEAEFESDGEKPDTGANSGQGKQEVETDEKE